MSASSRLLVLAFAASTVAGCYDDHGRLLGTPIAPGRDAGLLPPPRDASSRSDVPRPPPPIDAGASCPLVRADASCLESYAIPAGTAFELPFQFGCGCCVETSCDVEVDVASRTLRLGTHLCPDPCDCDACYTPTGSCSIPPLPLEALGEWTVEVNGVDAFEIGVIDAFDPVVAPPPGCAAYAEPDPCGAEVDFSMGPIRGDICVEHVLHADRESLTLHANCWSCGDLDSVCSTQIRERFTDDLPFGADIVLDARHYATNCDVDCPGVCIHHPRECPLPELIPGGFYRVFVDGEVVATFTQGSLSPPCSDF